MELPEGFEWRDGRPPRSSGVYLFTHDSAIVYVGRSINLFSRICSHIVNPWWRFACETSEEPGIWWARVDKACLSESERALLDLVRPRLNIRNPNDCRPCVVQRWERYRQRKISMAEMVQAS